MNQKVVEMNTNMISINHLILHNINEFDIITIFGHKNPDGDCYVSVTTVTPVHRLPLCFAGLVTTVPPVHHLLPCL
ncbi:MAG: hypothetical protein Q8853_02830, partial [Candidatus Phytoplasma australasiaticum]|nr:hypothetical protein [Candidatus Phytoplasma australasiaticum]